MTAHTRPFGRTGWDIADIGFGAWAIGGSWGDTARGPSSRPKGEAFDVGETFAGVPYDVALEAVEKIRPLVPQRASMAAFALRWILMADAVSVVIPGAKSPAQALANAAASELASLSPETMQAIRSIYERNIARHVHHRW